MVDKNFLISIGKRIAHIRQSHHITQTQLADILNVSPKHISHTECGTSGLSLKNLMEFCNYFNCSLDYIVFGKNKSDVTEKLPEEVIKLLNTGSAKEIELLNKYLKMYIELISEKQR